MDPLQHVLLARMIDKDSLSGHPSRFIPHSQGWRAQPHLLRLPLSFYNLSEAEIHMENNPDHKELRETRMDDDAEVVLSVSKKHIHRFEKMGFVTLASTSSDLCSGPSTPDVSVGLITAHMQALDIYQTSEASKAVDSDT